MGSDVSPAWPGSIGVIGAGSMGSALAAGFAGAGRPVGAHDAVCAISEAAAATDGVANVPIEEAASRALVCVAVKPQDADVALGAVREHLGPETVVLSVMAGWTLDRLEEALPGVPLVRTMPNLAIRHGAGLIARATRGLSGDREKVLDDLLAPLGTAVALPEELFSVATALAGSGPGFVALVAEAFEEGAVAAGMSPETARRMVPAVLAGTAALLKGGQDPAELRRRVSSPGGTTLAGLEVLERGEVRAHIRDAVAAAAARAEEL